ncbi:MAG: hypothetical protein M1821_007137 [Bathelium mastoideum]|nr:MAG: hypothetical protein M1821_007137 [Bathelium mastoideum]KAI9694647.1 MAG: hypothetical protein M1822_000263 [Bathelium mastoideum]
MPDITLYFLQASRAIRVAWLLEELQLDYKLEFANRENRVAPPAFREAIIKAGNPLGKSPTIVDGGLCVPESGTIVEYLCEQYDTSNRLIPKDLAARVQVLLWIHAAEGTFMVHAAPFLYVNWFAPQRVRDSGDLAIIEEGMSKNVIRDFDWLEGELQKGKGKFLVGDHITAADCMMLLNVQIITGRGFGTKGKKWPKVEEWIKRCEETETWKKAVQKTGFTLNP